MSDPQGDSIVSFEPSCLDTSSCAPIPDELETSSEGSFVFHTQEYQDKEPDSFSKLDGNYTTIPFNTLNQAISKKEESIKIISPLQERTNEWLNVERFAQNEIKPDTELEEALNQDLKSVQQSAEKYDPGNLRGVFTLKIDMTDDSDKQDKNIYFTKEDGTVKRLIFTNALAFSNGRQSQELFNAFKEQDKENIQNLANLNKNFLPPKPQNRMLKRCQTHKGAIGRKAKRKKQPDRMTVEFKKTKRSLSKRQSKLRANSKKLNQKLDHMQKSIQNQFLCHPYNRKSRSKSDVMKLLKRNSYFGSVRSTTRLPKAQRGSANYQSHQCYIQDLATTAEIHRNTSTPSFGIEPKSQNDPKPLYKVLNLRKDRFSLQNKNAPKNEVLIQDYSTIEKEYHTQTESKNMTSAEQTYKDPVTTKTKISTPKNSSKASKTSKSEIIFEISPCEATKTTTLYNNTLNKNKECCINNDGSHKGNVQILCATGTNFNKLHPHKTLGYPVRKYSKRGMNRGEGKGRKECRKGSKVRNVR
ncbi:unnamed protein product [Moneuplotes crassus]|uniref:Uncharacterized protein n=1 Tax=Euplotes crassus TaxID=5936 RepID=A0AAD1X775_EUPCR|nr:unnamed protein product [Moneuplotes crassus]